MLSKHVHQQIGRHCARREKYAGLSVQDAQEKFLEEAKNISWTGTWWTSTGGGRLPVVCQTLGSGLLVMCTALMGHWNSMMLRAHISSTAHVVPWQCIVVHKIVSRPAQSKTLYMAQGVSSTRMLCTLCKAHNMFW